MGSGTQTVTQLTEAAANILKSTNISSYSPNILRDDIIAVNILIFYLGKMLIIRFHIFPRLLQESILYCQYMSLHSDNQT